MYVYKDYNYVKYLFEDIPFEEALEIYLQADEQIHDERLWSLFLLSVEHGQYKGTFEEFKAKNKGMNKSKNMTNSQKEEIKSNTEDLREKIKKANATKVNVKNLK